MEWIWTWNLPADPGKAVPTPMLVTPAPHAIAFNNHACAYTYSDSRHNRSHAQRCRGQRWACELGVELGAPGHALATPRAVEVCPGHVHVLPGRCRCPVGRVLPLLHPVLRPLPPSRVNPTVGAAACACACACACAAAPPPAAGSSRHLGHQDGVEMRQRFVHGASSDHQALPWGREGEVTSENIGVAYLGAVHAGEVNLFAEPWGLQQS